MALQFLLELAVRQAHFLNLLIERFERTVFIDYHGRCLWTDSRNPRDVVRSVADQSLVIRQLRWFQTEPFHHRRLVVDHGRAYAFLRNFGDDLFAAHRLENIKITRKYYGL